MTNEMTHNNRMQPDFGELALASPPAGTPESVSRIGAAALTDIYHGIEPNLATEWWIVRVTFILVFVLAVTSVVFSLKMIRNAN